MDGLNTWLTIFLNHLNAGLALGVVLAVLILLRPLLLRLLTPQQWVAVWYVAWSIGIFGNLWGLTSLVRVLPVTVWDLLGPRPGAPPHGHYRGRAARPHLFPQEPLPQARGVPDARLDHQGHP